MATKLGTYCATASDDLLKLTVRHESGTLCLPSCQTRLEIKVLRRWWMPLPGPPACFACFGLGKPACAKAAAAGELLPRADLGGLGGVEPPQRRERRHAVFRHGHKAFLWLGVRGEVTALLNGEKVMEVESTTRYRTGQFRQLVELYYLPL